MPANLMAPVSEPQLPRDARAALAVTDSALKQANSRLTKSADWYEGVRQSYRGPAQ